MATASEIFAFIRVPFLLMVVEAEIQRSMKSNSTVVE